MTKTGDIVTTKKVHPCGGNTWQVMRTGADFKLKCQKCGHIILVDSTKLKKMIK